MNVDFVEPFDYYQKVLKNKITESAKEYFDELLDKSDIDVEANKKTIENYKKELELYNQCSNELSSLNTKIGWLIAGIVISGIAVVALVISLLSNPSYEVGLRVIFLLISLVALILCIVFLLKSLDKKDKAQEELEKHRQLVEAYKAEGYAQLSELNRAFDYGIPNALLNKANTVIQVDQMLDPSKLTLLKTRYGFYEKEDCSKSTLLLQSGSILGNPFVLKKDLRMRMGEKTYSNSIFITWTTVETDSEGHSRTVSHSETLTAYVSKPCPYYSTKTSLIYGNEAAPNLTFSRTPQEASSYDEKKLEKHLKKFDKKLDKMVQKDIDPSDGSVFTRLNNTKFEALFNALDRNNEREFRLLFTPLAQQNEIKVLQDKEIGYGDDFSFYKWNKVNLIISSHSQSFNYTCDPNLFKDFDLDHSKDKFVAYCNEYIKHIFFDLVPLLSIPLYQQTKTLDYIYDNSYPSNITMYEDEVLANAFDRELLKPAGCVTPIINNAEFIGKTNNKDLVKVTSYGFRVTQEVEHVTRMGGDGHLHTIPVTYDVYHPIKKYNYMNAYANPVTRKQYEALNNHKSGIICNDGIIAELTGAKSNSTGLENIINNLIKEK